MVAGRLGNQVPAAAPLAVQLSGLGSGSVTTPHHNMAGNNARGTQQILSHAVAPLHVQVKLLNWFLWAYKNK